MSEAEDLRKSLTTPLVKERPSAAQEGRHDSGAEVGKEEHVDTVQDVTDDAWKVSMSVSNDTLLLKKFA